MGQQEIQQIRNHRICQQVKKIYFELKLLIFFQIKIRIWFLLFQLRKLQIQHQNPIRIGQERGRQLHPESHPHRVHLQSVRGADQDQEDDGLLHHVRRLSGIPGDIPVHLTIQKDEAGPDLRTAGVLHVRPADIGGTEALRCGHVPEQDHPARKDDNRKKRRPQRHRHHQR